LAQIYAPNRLSAGALPQTHWGSLHRPPPRPFSWFRGGTPGNGKEGGRGKRGRGGREEKGGEGVPECPNAELASLYI